MAENQATSTFSNLLKNPGEIANILQNPGKYGLDVYKSMSNQNKQYLVFAAGIGLIIYGITLRKKAM